MTNLKYKHHVEAWTPEEFRSFVDSHHPDDYQLIDVRQQFEYAEGHLASAISLPVDNLPQHVESLVPHKPTLIYCNQGNLSPAAAEVFARAGFASVYYLSSGFRSWQHETPSGSPQEVCASLLNLESATEQAKLAWHMEEAARLFYQEVSETIEDTEVAALFAELVIAEAQHKTTLMVLWEALAGHPAETDFSESFEPDKKIMEGGLGLNDALAMAKKSSPAEIVDYAMALELSAYDQYLYLQRNSTNPDSQRLFEVMADEERHHLKALAASLEKLSQQA